MDTVELALEHSVVERGDARLHVVRSRVAPHERRAPLLFVHGYPDTHATWSRQLEGLAAMHPVAAFDLRGVGASTIVGEPRAATRMARYVEDIEAVIDHVAGPGGQVHLVGHDWGGVLAWQFAGDPERAGRLRSLTVIAAPHGAAALAMLRARLRRHSLADLAVVAEQLRRSWYLFLFQLPKIPELYLGRDPVRTWVGAHRRGGVPRGDPELADIDPAWARSALVALLPLYRQMFARTTLRELHELRKGGPRTITTPVCLVVPQRDLALTPELYENIAEFVPELERHDIDDNHWVHRSRAAEVNQIVHDFVARHEA
ncbi:alpha/beta fold hydrolase [Nannocystis sp.]|uniref:alpha/beta fold hydrolase n=1 Tax=Nannocystis sp. TaxID=1962667 RepID=UPI0025CCAE07|nr:alpha/beta fold hydrolase [Nannocystis sp.]